MSKDKLIRFRCTEKEHKAITDAAKREGLTLTSYILSKLNCSHKNKFVATKGKGKTKVVATNKDKVKNVATNKDTTVAKKSWAELLQEKRKKKVAE